MRCYICVVCVVRPERYMEHMRGGLDTLGPGHAMPSLLMEEAEAVTPHTLQLHRVGRDSHETLEHAPVSRVRLICSRLQHE